MAYVSIARGRPGKTHCGSWMPVPPGDIYGWRTRLVCTKQPNHPRRPHRSSDGWCWSANSPIPFRPRTHRRIP